MNEFNGIGKCITDVEFQTTPNGTEMCKFAIAINRTTKGSDGYYESDVFNCVAFKHNAKFIANYFKKLDGIGINGRLQVNKFQDNNGNNRTSVSIIVNKAFFVSNKQDAENQQNNNYQQQPQYNNNQGYQNNNNYNQNPQQQNFTGQPQQSRYAPQNQQPTITKDFDDFEPMIASPDGDLPF